jgi:hypothetical protein
MQLLGAGVTATDAVTVGAGAAVEVVVVTGAGAGEKRVPCCVLLCDCVVVSMLQAGGGLQPHVSLSVGFKLGFRVSLEDGVLCWCARRSRTPERRRDGGDRGGRDKAETKQGSKRAPAAAAAEDPEIVEANALRAKLGLKPLKM